MDFFIGILFWIAGDETGYDPAERDEEAFVNKRSFEQQIRAGCLCQGMSFSQRVWALTARIPRGQVATYADIARKLGTRGYRAVGHALNRNPYAPAVPCHRVVGSDGSLTGFASGLRAKRRLLRGEGVAIQCNKADLSRRFGF